MRSTTLFPLLLIALSGTVVPSRATKYDMELTSKGCTYEVSYDFETSCIADSLYAIFHHPKHVRTYLARASLDIEVIDSAGPWNRLAYTYKYYISRLVLTFSRDIVKDSQIVIFSLESCSSWGSEIIPRVVSATGRYTVHDSAGVRRVAYRQRTTLDRPLNRLYLYFIRRDTWRFLRDLERYAEDLPGGSPQAQPP